MAAQAQAQAQVAGGAHGLDPWLGILRRKIQAEPEPATLAEAIAPLARLLDVHGQPKVDVVRAQAACDRLLAAPQADWHPEDWRRTHPDFPQKYALAIHVYTLQEPNIYSPLGASLHDVANRANGPGGISADVAACLPFVKLLDSALEEVGIVWGFFVGQAFRGVKFAFPNSSETPAR
eukprot:COSAG04_NODE_1108_length_8231_cov_5.606247_4_plen_178_part_00